MSGHSSADSSRRRIIVVAVVFCVALTSLAAGLTWRNWIIEPAKPGQSIDQLRKYEEHWKVLNSSPVKVDDWANKVVLLNFWGSWCPPCVEEMPLLDQFNSEHNSIQIVGIVIDQEGPAKLFLKKHEISFPSLLFNQTFVNELLGDYQNTDFVLPYSVAFDRSGKRFFTKVGPLDKQVLEYLIE